MKKKIYILIKIGLKKAGLFPSAIRVQAWIHRLGKERRTFRIDSVFNYCREKQIDVNTIVEKHERIVYGPPIFGIEPKETKRMVEAPSIYYAQIKNATIIGSNNSFIVEECCLNDKLLLSYSEDYSYENGACYSFEQNQDKAGFYIDKHPEVIKEGINMFGEASLNYYHWMIDILGRIVYINRFSELKDVPLIVDWDAVRNDSYMEALNAVDEYNHPIITVRRNEAICVEKLHYFSPVTFAGVYPNKKTKEIEYDRALSYSKCSDSVRYYQKQMSEYAKTTASPVGGKLFITRGATKHRRLVNEKEAANLAVKYGFCMFNPSDYSFKEQIAAYRDADIIIGDEGAAFTNVMWGGKNTMFVIILPEIWHNYVFSSLAYVSGCKCEYLNAEPIEKEGRDHFLDIRYFEKFLEVASKSISIE